MRKKELALAVIERLKKEYPDSDCTLDYNEAWKLLISVRLAAQCTDARVNIIVPKLYEKFPDVNALADAPVEEIEEIVRPCGLGKSKARDINACMKMITQTSGRRSQKRQPYHGRRLRQTCNRHRYPLYPTEQPYRSCARNQRSKESRNGIVEDHSSGRRQFSLSPLCRSRTRSLHRPYYALLRQMLSGRHL